MTDKKLPKVLRILLELLGFIMGLSFAVLGFLIALFFGDWSVGLLIWASTIIVCLVVLQIIEWRHFELLKEWGILKEKKEEKKQ